MQNTIAIVWTTDDVLEVAPNLTIRQAREVLQAAERHHDASIGINWDVLSFWADEVSKQARHIDVVHLLASGSDVPVRVA